MYAHRKDIMTMMFLAYDNSNVKNTFMKYSYTQVLKQ